MHPTQLRCLDTLENRHQAHRAFGYQSYGTTSPRLNRVASEPRYTTLEGRGSCSSWGSHFSLPNDNQRTKTVQDASSFPSTFGSKHKDKQPKDFNIYMQQTTYNSLDAIISQYGDKPELLQIMLLTKAEEDRRHAEEAKLRSKQIDLYYIEQSRIKSALETTNTYAQLTHTQEQRKQDPQDTQPHDDNSSTEKLSTTTPSFNRTTHPSVFVESSKKSPQYPPSLPSIRDLAKATLPEMFLSERNNVPHSRINCSDQPSPPNVFVPLPRTCESSRTSPSSVSSINSPKSFFDLPLTTRLKESYFSLASDIQSIESVTSSVGSIRKTSCNEHTYPPFQAPAVKAMMDKPTEKHQVPHVADCQSAYSVKSVNQNEACQVQSHEIITHPIANNKPTDTLQGVSRRSMDLLQCDETRLTLRPLEQHVPNKLPISPVHHTSTFASYTAQRNKPRVKRKRREMQTITMIIETKEFPYNDNYAWKNNGNTIRKCSGNKAIYYKCANKACTVNKTVTFKDDGSYLIKYRGKHLQDCSRITRIVNT